MSNRKLFTVPVLRDDEDVLVKPLFKAGIIISETEKKKETDISVSDGNGCQSNQREAVVEQSASSSSSIANVAVAEKRKVTQKSNCILVQHKQRGNLLLKSIRNANWEYAEIEPDYLMGQQTCALFLSLRYHNLYPNYIYERLKSLGKSYKLQVLLVLIDVSDPNVPLKELAKVAVLSDCTLMCAWSYEEAARVIETYKMFEHKSPQLIMEKQMANANGVEGNYKCAIDALSSIKSINKTDAITLVSMFESLENIVKKSPEQLELCSGLGPQKAERLHQLFRRPFQRC